MRFRPRGARPGPVLAAVQRVRAAAWFGPPSRRSVRLLVDVPGQRVPRIFVGERDETGAPAVRVEPLPAAVARSAGA